MEREYKVYLTQNMVNGNIYVGVHQESNTDDGYLGCGIYRKTKIKNPISAFQEAVMIFGQQNFQRIILKSTSSREEAYMVEATIVTPEFLQREDVYNECIGGVSPGGSNKIPLLQYDLQGNFKREWESGIAVTQYYTGNNTSRAIYGAVDKEDKQCYGSLWRKKQSNDYPLKIAPLKHNYKKPVARYTLDGLLLDTWDSADQAATKCLKKKNGRQIKKACENEAVALGYQWRYIKSEKPMNRIKEYEDPSTVYQLNDNFKIVNVWESSGKLYKEGYLNIVGVLKEKDGRIRCKGSRFVHAINYDRYCKKHRAIQKKKK